MVLFCRAEGGPRLRGAHGQQSARCHQLDGRTEADPGSRRESLSLFFNGWFLRNDAQDIPLNQHNRHWECAATAQLYNVNSTALANFTTEFSDFIDTMIRSDTFE